MLHVWKCIFYTWVSDLLFFSYYTSTVVSFMFSVCIVAHFVAKRQKVKGKEKRKERRKLLLPLHMELSVKPPYN